MRNLPEGMIPSDLASPVIELERTRDVSHGDFACNLAMRLSKAAKRNPRELANALIAALPATELLSKVEVAGPGFINFHLSPTAYAQELETIHTSGVNYGCTDAGQHQQTRDHLEPQVTPHVILRT